MFLVTSASQICTFVFVCDLCLWRADSRHKAQKNREIKKIDVKVRICTEFLRISSSSVCI